VGKDAPACENIVVLSLNYSQFSKISPAFYE